MYSRCGLCVINFALAVSALKIAAVDPLNKNLVNKHPAWQFLSEDCGESFADRIIGGVEAGLGQFPWIARLGYQEESDHYVEYKCGGALLNPWYVVSAAHCVTNLDGLTLVTVRMGEHDTTTAVDCRAGLCAPPPQDRRVFRSTFHPRFNKPAFANDIAIVEVKEPFEITNYVTPICLLRGPTLHDLKIGDVTITAGWGIMNMTTMDTATVLQTIQIPVLERAQCKNLGKTKLAISESQICAGAEKNKDACSGDSGGPLMMVEDTPEGPLTVLVGVVSFGPDLCGFGLPGVYTSVSRYMMWILDHIRH